MPFLAERLEAPTLETVMVGYLNEKCNKDEEDIEPSMNVHYTRSIHGSEIYVLPQDSSDQGAAYVTTVLYDVLNRADE